MMASDKAGTIRFALVGDKAGPIESGPVAVVAHRVGQTLEIRFASEHFWHTFTGPAPATDRVTVMVAWEAGSHVTLWLDDKRVQSVPWAPTAH